MTFLSPSLYHFVFMNIIQTIQLIKNISFLSNNINIARDNIHFHNIHTLIINHMVFADCANFCNIFAHLLISPHAPFTLVPGIQDNFFTRKYARYIGISNLQLSNILPCNSKGQWVLVIPQHSIICGLTTHGVTFFDSIQHVVNITSTQLSHELSIINNPIYSRILNIISNHDIWCTYSLSNGILVKNI